MVFRLHANITDNYQQWSSEHKRISRKSINNGVQNIHEDYRTINKVSRTHAKTAASTRLDSTGLDQVTMPAVFINQMKYNPLYSEQVTVVVTIQICIREVISSNTGPGHSPS
jgi:hypothetical protein